MSGPDRSAAPAPGAAPAFRPPALGQERLASGVRVAIAESSALPFAILRVAVEAGHRWVPPGEAGRAALTADAIAEGTRLFDGTALVDELDGLGATLDVHADDDEIVLELTLLARHLERGLELCSDLLLEPRFAPDDVERARRARLARLEVRSADPAALAGDAWRAVLFGDDAPAGRPPAGTRASIAGIARERLIAAWQAALVPSRIHVAGVGPAPARAIADLLPRLAALAPPAEPLALPPGGPPAGARSAIGSGVTLVDRPGAPQSQIRIGHLAVPAGHEDFFALSALNHPLGGAFTSRLNLNLRERRGWTYGVRSGFSGGLAAGWFQVATAVETGVTAPAIEEIVRELTAFRAHGVRADEVEFARAALARTLLRQYEPAAAKASFAANVAKYGWAPDYPLRRLAWLERMQAGDLSSLASRHLDTNALAIVCVGDAARLEPSLEALGLGEIVHRAPA